MVLLTDISFFVGELNIPNTDSPEVSSALQLFIQKYEPRFVQDILGYSLYKALQTALAVTPVAQRWQELLFGKEYTCSYTGRLKKWRGLIDTDSDYYTFNAGTVTYKAPKWLEVGITRDSNSTVIIPVQATSFTLTDAIGWTPVFFRYGAGPMQQDKEYSWNGDTGLFTLLLPLDRFEAGERLFTEYQLALGSSIDTPSPTFTYKQSCIADYIYFYYQRDHASRTTGTGEKVANIGNAESVSNGDKMVSAWNDMAHWLRELWEYLDTNKVAYPEWYGRDYCLLQKYRTINSFGI